ncbi:short-chain dehydrogenase [Halobacteriales archaeon QS_5_70_17]|nr:MAG: short-chain dehydrogenase [Halobacteriales archaeon QS_5_70_17]
MGSASFDFADATVAVAGGASGVGRAAALAFARAGATVVVAAGREAPADPHASVPTHRVIREGGGTAEYVEFDRATDDPSAVLAAAREAGGADVLVDDATGADAIDARSADRESAIRAAAAEMADRGRGSVVAVTRPGARSAAAETVVDAALAFAGDGVRVNGVVARPGPTAESGMGASQSDGSDGNETESETETEDDFGGVGATRTVGTGESATDRADPGDVLLGSAGYPEDVVPAVLFLTSGAAGRVTGELLAVDGGQAARRSAGRSDSESST